MQENFIKLNGRVVIVAGAAGGGIGTTVTSMVARAGATVVAVSRSEDHLAQHIKPLADEGLAVVPVAADISTDEGIETAMAAARKAEGNLYGLVNVAGAAAPQTWMHCARVTRKDFRDLFTQNLETMFFMSQAVARELKEKGLSKADKADSKRLTDAADDVDVQAMEELTEPVTIGVEAYISEAYVHAERDKLCCIGI